MGIQKLEELCPDLIEGSTARRETGSKGKLGPKKTKKSHLTIVEGLLYLLKNEALKHPNASNEEFKKYLEDIIIKDTPEKLTPDLIEGNLIDKLRKKEETTMTTQNKKRRQIRAIKQTKKRVFVSNENASQESPSQNAIDNSKEDRSTNTNS